MKRRRKLLPSPTGLTDACFFDIAQFELQADPHRVYLGFRLYSGAQFWLHLAQTDKGLQVLLDQDRGPSSFIARYSSSSRAG